MPAKRVQKNVKELNGEKKHFRNYEVQEYYFGYCI